MGRRSVHRRTKESKEEDKESLPAERHHMTERKEETEDRRRLRLSSDRREKEETDDTKVHKLQLSKEQQDELAAMEKAPKEEKAEDSGSEDGAIGLTWETINGWLIM